MRFLKKKIALAHGFHAQEHKKTVKVSEEEDTQKQLIARQASPKLKNISESYRTTKNIVKSYGRAISAFALSKLASPYLDNILGKEGLTIHQFTQYLEQFNNQLMD